MKDNASIVSVPSSYSRDIMPGVKVSSGGTFTMQDNTKISSRKGGYSGGYEYGAGIDIREGGIVVLKGSALITGNTGERGGGIHIRDGSLTVQDNAKITGNTADKGGGIYVANYRNVTVILKGNTEISGNTAKQQGGGIYYEGGRDSDYNLYRHQASYMAGFMSVDGEKPGNYILNPAVASVAIQEQATIKDNTAKEGGGVYAEKGAIAARIPFTVSWPRNSYPEYKATKVEYLTGGVVISGGSIQGNKADYGAGVYAAEAETETTITEPGGNNLVRETKKPPVNAPAVTLAGGSISGNAAEFVGGGVYQKKAGAFAQSKGTLSGNTAGDGEGEDLYKPE
jgi:predicted outer membrane repeat protein